MIRDFSREAKETLCRQVDQIAPHGMMASAGDFFGDLGIEVQAWMGELNIDSYVDNISRYHEKVLDRNNATKKQIDKIFQEVEAVDESYAGNFSDITDILVQYRSCLGTMSEIILPGCMNNFIAAHISVQDLMEQIQSAEVEMWVNLYISGQEVKIDSRKRKIIEAYIAQKVNHLGRDVTQLNAPEDKEMQERVVVLYQMLDRETAERFIEFFDSAETSIGEFDRNNIMYIVYTADEPFRSLFLDSLGTYTIQRTDVSGSYFSPYGNQTDGTSANTINFNAGNSFYHCPKGAYNTFFHECGHAIDFNVGDSAFYSNHYADGTNYDMIAEDVYTHIEKEIADYISNKVAGGGANAAEYEACSVENIINCIKNGGDKTGLSYRESKVYDVINNRMYNALSMSSSTQQYEDSYGQSRGIKYFAGVSDVYGGVTGNVISGDRTHSSTEYWYDAVTGESTGNQEVELWAHYFSFEITGNQEAMSAMNQYFPESMNQYDKMAGEMKKCYKGSE